MWLECKSIHGWHTQHSKLLLNLSLRSRGRDLQIRIVISGQIRLDHLVCVANVTATRRTPVTAVGLKKVYNLVLGDESI